MRHAIRLRESYLHLPQINPADRAARGKEHLMTDEELTAIRERAQRATPGPWESQGFDSYPGDEGSAVVGTPGTKGSGLVAYALRPKDRHEDGESGADWYDADQCDDDANFIAHARTDVPALVAEVERLQGIIDRVQKRARLESERCDSDLSYLAEINDGSSMRRVSAEQYAWRTVLDILDGEEQS